MREKDQADFDLERMFEMLDTAITSKDERVQNALRSLLTIIALTKPQDDGRLAAETSYGPLRQMQEDLKNINRRVNNLENEYRQFLQKGGGNNNPWVQPGGAGGLPASPYTNPGSPYGVTYTGTNPNQSEWKVK